MSKNVILTGAFGDIGKATAEKFAKNGFNLALTYNNSIDQDFINKLKSFGVNVFALHCDQTKESDIINFVNSAILEFGKIDICVCNAGISEKSTLLTEKSTNDIDFILSTNLRGTILFNREILKHFSKMQSGNVVNVSSIYGISGGSMESVYSATKAGIIGLTKSLAVEASPFVRVNAVAPGCIDTKMNAEFSEETMNYVKNETPLERLGTAEDVANAIYFLATDESSFVTGEVLKIAGGVERL